MLSRGGDSLKPETVSSNGTGQQDNHTGGARNSTADHALADPTAACAARFTPRQADILRLIASGYSDKDLARELGVSYGTVRTHLDRMFERFGVRTRSALIFRWTLMANGDPSESLTITAN